MTSPDIGRDFLRAKLAELPHESVRGAPARYAKPARAADATLNVRPVGSPKSGTGRVLPVDANES